MGGSRSHSEFYFWKSSHISLIPALIFWGIIPGVFCVYIHTLLKVVSHYDFFVLSMSEMDFEKKVWIGGWMGGVSSNQYCLGFR